MKILAHLVPLLLFPVLVLQSGPDQRASNVEMADRLAQLDHQWEPQENVYANEERVRWFRNRMMQSTSADAFLHYWTNYAVELLNSAQPQLAIEEWNKILRYLKEQRPEVYEEKHRSLATLLAASHLLLGERQNCLLNHTSDSCLLPIQGGGIHQLPQGSRGAIAVLSDLLIHYPGDAGSRWLLNLAYMTLGEYPEEVPEPWRLPPDLFESEHPMKRFRDIAPQLGVAVNDLSGGTILDDFNNDGHMDIMASSFRLDSQLKLFSSQGDGTFKDSTKAAGITGITGGLNLVQSDYNNDGHVDVLVLRGGWLMEAGRQPNSLLKNNGDGTFTDVTQETGLFSLRPTQTAVWLDFDGDGWLDLFVGNESSEARPHRSELFRNNQDGTFSECAFESGLRIYGYVKGVTSGDFNNDGRPDLFLSVFGGENLLFRNDGPATDSDGDFAWRFTEMAAEAGVQQPVDSFPCWFFDYDNDGWEDLFVASYDLTDFSGAVAELLQEPTSAETMRLYRNNGDGTFEDRTVQLGLDSMQLAMGSNFGDLDNDGWLDFYLGTGNPDFRALVPNKMYRNNGGKNFQDVSTSGGFGHLQKGHAIAFADLDNDGDQDVYANMGGAYSGDVYPNALFENPGTTNDWIGLQLAGTQSNRSAIGARIRVETKTASGKRTIHRTVTSGGSFGASPLAQHIGLGQSEEVEEVKIYWPASGIRQVFSHLAINQWHRIEEGDSHPGSLERKPASFQTAGMQHSSPTSATHDHTRDNVR